LTIALVVQERYTYSSFGKVNIFSGDFSVARNVSAYNWTRMFTGQVVDSETGLMLYRNRVYHPTLGRFLQRAPVGYSGDLVGLYRYVSGMPTIAVDPHGLFNMSACIARENGICDRQYPGFFNTSARWACKAMTGTICAKKKVEEDIIPCFCNAIKPLTDSPTLGCICLLLYVADTLPGIGSLPGHCNRDSLIGCVCGIII
jgi:RHS repeat-associated protein